MNHPLVTDATQEKVLGRALEAIRRDGDVLAGPWTGEVGFELLYWIPFLAWLAAQGPGGRRMAVVSRGGAAPWYRHLSNRYVDILDLVTPDEFRARTAGKKKQYDRKSEFDRELLDAARVRLGLGDAAEVHPSTMFRLFAPLWRKRATIDLAAAFSSFAPLAPLPRTGRPAGVPADYVVAKFYFSKAFPDTGANRAFVAATLARVSRHVPVAQLSTALRLDEHSDYHAHAGSNVFPVDAHACPQRNLEVQSALIAGARGFIGTYGGFSYLAPFYGAPSLSFYSRRGFEAHHLELAHHVFDRLLPDGFVALDRRDEAGLDPAFDRFVARAAKPGLTVAM